MSVARKASLFLLATLSAYGALVGTNEGEFWPFSIYPMFSQGGKPWSRAIVVEVEDDVIAWDTLSANDLPGEPFGLLEHGIDPIDLSNFVSKTRTWDAERVRGLEHMFQEQRASAKNLLVMRVNGRLLPSDSVEVSFVPYALMTPTTTHLNPALDRGP